MLQFGCRVVAYDSRIAVRESHAALDRFRGASRWWAVASVVLTATGGGWAVASLWYPWAVDGPLAGVGADLNGWQWMGLGDVLILAAAAVAVVCTGQLCLARPSKSTTWGAGLFALAVLGLAAAAAALVWWLTGFDFIVMDEHDLREHGQGGGARRAVTGLVVAALGVVCAMRSRAGDPLPPAPAGVIVFEGPGAERAAP